MDLGHSQHSFVQPHHPVHLGGEALVVGRDQRGAAFAADQAEEFGEHRVGGRFVEVAGRLVGEHQRRAVGERAGDRDALLLAARQLGRAMVEPLRQAERAEQLLGARRARRRASAPWIICGSMTFSSASKSGSRWWNW